MLALRDADRETGIPTISPLWVLRRSTITGRRSVTAGGLSGSLSASAGLGSQISRTGSGGHMHEGDTLRSVITVERLQQRDGLGGLAHVRSVGTADGEHARDVLKWHFTAFTPNGSPHASPGI